MIEKDYARDYPSLVRKSSNTREDSINVTSLGHEIENVNSNKDNSAKGKKLISLIDNTINNVNSDKDIGVASRIPTSDKKDVMDDFCIGKPRQSKSPKGLNLAQSSSVLSLEGKDQVGYENEQSACRQTLSRSSTILPNDSEREDVEDKS
ncbi:hypothetical protein H5410_061422 [Solanum commersonii]|uniref:Uncharacterized protein n=1 Tax=Solanum commersonii TaxID=4109 RepID=A0A9J5W941_SOLCO|nr:hypothetical protein H5410_061422 [Solanum commersonii]